MLTYSECTRELTKTGAAFELCSSMANGVPVRDFINRPRSLAEIAAGLTQYGDRTCTVFGKQRNSYTELAAEVATVSGRLQSEFGVSKGDRVAILSANNPEWVISFWAVVVCGGVCAALNGWWKADEIIFALRDSGSKILVADVARFDRIADRLGELPQLEAIFLIDGDDQTELSRDHIHQFARLSVPLTDAVIPVSVVDEDAVAIIYTSGTTGRPKGAVVTQQSWITGLMNMAFATEVAWLMYPEVDIRPQPIVVLCTLPFFHVAGAHGLVLGAVAGGATLIIPQGKLDAARSMSLIENERVTRWASVPAMVWRLCTYDRRHEFDLSSVKDIGYGGSPSSPRHQELARETFPGLKAVSNAYGLTETGSVIAMITGTEFEERPDSVGRPFPTVEVRVADKSGNSQRPGVAGEILVKGPMLMRGYWTQPTETREAIQDGWLRTGDIGHLDNDGFLYVTDRVKDIIIRGGENVSSAETESRIMEHPDVLEVAVIGVAHDELGEEVKAFVRLNSNAFLSVAEIQEWVGRKLADFKVPSLIEFRRNPLPRNALGKLLKNELRNGQ